MDIIILLIDIILCLDKSSSRIQRIKRLRKHEIHPSLYGCYYYYYFDDYQLSKTSKKIMSSRITNIRSDLSSVKYG